MAHMELAKAAIPPITNAGKFPPPKAASKGPLTADTKSCGITMNRFRIPKDSPVPRGITQIPLLSHL